MAKNRHDEEETVATSKPEVWQSSVSKVEPLKAASATTLRDQIACHVLTGILSHRSYPAGSEAALATEVYAYADAMLAAREPKQEQTA